MKYSNVVVLYYLVLIFSGINIGMVNTALCRGAGTLLQDEVEQEARKKAETEFNSLNRRGWTVRGGDLQDALLQNWRKRVVKDENDIYVYMIAYGNASAPTLEEAEAEALKKAREQISGPMIMYFQSWNMAAEGKGDVTADEATAIRNAVNASEKTIRQVFFDLGIPPDLSMYREQRRAIEVHVRLMYPQLELRQMAKEIIAAELEQSVGWDKETSFRLMSYPK